MIEQHTERRGHAFYPETFNGIPALYATEDVEAGDKVIYLHYFFGGWDWYVAEVSEQDGVAFGYTYNGTDSEWGYFSLVELESLLLPPYSGVVERDLGWVPVPAREVPKISA